jgi:hypothetical protein
MAHNFDIFLALSIWSGFHNSKIIIIIIIINNDVDNWNKQCLKESFGSIVHVTS